MPTHNPDKDILSFQCKDILSRDIYELRSSEEEEYSSESEPKDNSNDKISNRYFQILLFGTDRTGTSICLKVDNFRPFFYVRIPDILYGQPTAKSSFLHWLLLALPSATANEVELTEETHSTLFDFTNNKASSFYKITTPSQTAWRILKDKLLTKSTSEPIQYETKSLFGKKALDAKLCASDVESISADGTRVALKIYEANIDPVLRFFHIQEVSPAGWIKVDAGNWSKTEKRDAKTNVYATTDWCDVHPEKDGGMAPYLVGSWDIECNSSHGDFPIAQKTWRKPLREMLEQDILPSTVEELCEIIAQRLNDEDSPLSPIYLKMPKTYLPDTLNYMLEGRDMKNATLKHLTNLRNTSAGDPNRDTYMTALDKVLTSVFPKIAGDEIIQIGTVLYRLGAPVSKHIWVLGSVDESAVKPPGIDVPITVMGYKDEGSLLRAWFEWIGRKQPDILIGYNIFGFDSKYVWDRLEETVTANEIKQIVAPLSCLTSRPPRLEEKFLSSSAMGDNTMWFIGSPGRLQIDLLPYIRRNHNLDSYSLDNVSATFVSGVIKGSLTTTDNETFVLRTKSTKGTVPGRFITLMDEENDRIVEKCLVLAVEASTLTVRIEGGRSALDEHGAPPVRWAQVKDDVHPKDIFRLHRGSASDRAIVARYCLQDCDLVMELFHKLEILNNSVAMASVCSVPVSYIFLRGQGIKIESLIFKECRIADQLIEVMPSKGFAETIEIANEADSEKEEEDSYEGAIVLEPKTGIYIDDPITADDFASLYPSSIISENISHDTLISVKDYNTEGEFIGIREGSDTYDNLPGASYVNIEFDILRPDPSDTRKNPEKIRMGTRVARYIQKPQGTIPRILEMLLASRKKCRKLAETEVDEFRKALLDAQQLAYKLTANSLYGQLGSGTFKIRRQVLAASTTAYGRKQLMYAKAVIEKVYGGGVDPRCDVECIYGDTDSIFLRFRPKDPITGKRLHGQAALVMAKELTIESGKLVSSCLKRPHDFEFDKIFRSFCLLSKKRYVGDMSEDGLENDDFHRKSMGIVMKRRDNAPIVKYVYRRAIDAILDQSRTDAQSGVKEAFHLVQSIARDLLDGKFPLSKLTITKSLRAEYKDPTRIAHKVLADRIGERDPGNKPSTSDRIPYVYITRKGPVPKLQGDRIELPSYIKEHNLTPDYAFYITNQIAKPVAQVFGLAVESIPGVKKTDLAHCMKARDPVEAREKLAYSLLFENVLVESSRVPAKMEANGQRSMASFFQTDKNM